jgi:hypothetical protein
MPVIRGKKIKGKMNNAIRKNKSKFRDISATLQLRTTEVSWAIAATNEFKQ